MKKYTFSQKEIEKGVKAFQEFRKVNKKSPMFFSDTITNEQVACYVLWTIACLGKHINKDKKD